MRYSLGVTINLGNYQSIKPEVISDDLPFEEAEAQAREKLEQNIKNINAHYGTFFELPPRVS